MCHGVASKNLSGCRTREANQDREGLEVCLYLALWLVASRRLDLDAPSQSRH